MMRRLKKKAMSILTAMVVLTSAFGIGSVRVQAADPYWGAGYVNADASSIDITIDDITRDVSHYTVRAWDFTGSVYITVEVYNPNWVRVNYNTTVVTGNGDIPQQIISLGNVKGTYHVRCTISYATSGGWIGVWLY